MGEQWKSPRVVELEVKEYRVKRFEEYMTMVDSGKLELSIACAALREEIINSEIARKVA